MLGYMLAALAEQSGDAWSIRTAGTFVIEGSSISARTRDALLGVPELGQRRYGVHRSHQIDGDDVKWADVILASEADHVRFIRARFDNGGSKTVLLAQFVRDAPLNAPFVEQLAAVSDLDPSPLLDVLDPAGGDQAAYDACASQLWDLATAFALLVREEEPR